MKHFYVQVIGGIVLHQGRISEMKTGEGKTLVATLPAYLNALEGKGVHVVTVNDYLAKRDMEWMEMCIRDRYISVQRLFGKRAQRDERGYSHIRRRSFKDGQKCYKKCFRRKGIFSE